MALTVTDSLTFSATKVILTDDTGNYDAGTNPGGYGAPNALFTDYAHYAIIRKKNVNLVDDVVLTLEAYNPLSATTFQTDRATDGWYEGVKLNIPVWTAGTYSSGTVKYYSGSIYESNTSTSATPGSDGTWVVVTDLTTIEDNSTIIATPIGGVTAYDANVYWSGQIADRTRKAQWGIQSDDKLRIRLGKILDEIENVLVAQQLGNFTDGEFCVLRLRILGAKR